jgi:hypothetical protein
MDTIETDKLAEPKAQPAEEATTQEDTAEDATAESVPDAVTDDGEALVEDSEGDFDVVSDEDDLDGAAAVPGATSSDVLSGAASVVGAGLGLASLTGTWLGTLMANRQQLIGQIKAQSGSSANPIADVYGTPWHTTALFNGLFALVAIIVAGAVLLRQQFTPGPLAAPWVKAVAWGALALGVIGLLIAGAMWFDLFTTLPVAPTSPTGSTG